MKQFFSFIASVFFALTAWGQTSFTFTSADDVIQEKDGIIVMLDKGTGSNDPRYQTDYETGKPEMRLYTGNTITVSSETAMTTIQVGETKSVDFIIEGLNPADEYFFFIEYSSAGKQNRLLTGYPFTLTEEKEGEEEPEEPGNTPKPGDANGDGVVNDEDIEAVVHYIMTGDTTNFVIENANVNGDDKVDVADIVLILEMRE